jgi:hypothetical protein
MFAQMNVWWLVAAFMGVSFVSFVFRTVLGIFQTVKRANGAAAAAQELGFTFTPWMGPDAAPKIGTELFQKDPGGTCKNVMTGNYSGMDVQLLDYGCTTGNAGHSTTTVQTVAVYKQNVDLPIFTLQPKNLALTIVDKLQHQHVDLDYPPGLSQHYSVRGRDKDTIRSLFNGSLISFVEGLDRSKGWHIEGAGNALVLYRYRGKVKPTELRDFLQETSTIAQSFFAFSRAKAAAR